MAERGVRFNQLLYRVWDHHSKVPDNYGRDHHPRCFSGWLAGGGINHERLSFPLRGLDQRLTGVNQCKVIRDFPT
jgi:hypothetical protein